MGRLVYYVPGERKATPESLEAWGLAYIRDGSGPASAATTKGPDGGHGVLFTCQAGGVSGLEAGRWAKLHGSAVGAWVGYLEAERPGPADLERRKLVRGHGVQLEDGSTWTVPVARSLGGGTAFPRALGWDGKTWTEGDVLPAYVDLFADALRVWEALAGEAGLDMPKAEAYSIAARALGVNYRVGADELAQLGLLSSESAGQVLLALIDWPSFEALKKKQASAGDGGRPGDGD